MNWSIDAGDAFAVARVRRSAIDEIRSMSSESTDLFALELVLGELLASEMERGHWSLAVSVESDVAGPTVHVYAQGTPAIAADNNDYRKAILRGTRVPMTIEASAQGTHTVLRPPPESSSEAMFRARAAEAYQHAQEIRRRYTY